MNRYLRFLADNPIGEDRFGRAPFARAISNALVLPAGSEGLVIGIEGAWGSGKSFVINQVKSFLCESEDGPIVVEFNPWIISGTDSLVEALLDQIGSAIGAEKDPERKAAAIKAGSSVLRYLSLVRHLKYLKYVPGASAVGNAAEDLAELAERAGKAASEGADDLGQLEKELPEHGLESRKMSTISALADLNRPIIIILDDLDRLPAEEIRSVFQAVKAVANFPRIAYLLSYDPTIAARAMDSDVSVGLSYLEKIVQVQYSLPLPLPWRTRAFVVTRLRETLIETRRELTPDEEARFDEVASYVARMCRTPRDAIRICNRLRISLPFTKDEVDTCDVILLEAIGVCERHIDDAIRKRPEDFAGSTNIEFEGFGQEFYFAEATARREKSKEEKVKEAGWRKHIKGSLTAYTEGALNHLFPKERVRGTRRVQNWDRLFRFLALGPSEFIVEISDLQKLIADEHAFRDALSSDDKSALSILRSIEIYRTELQTTNEESLLILLCSLAEERCNRNLDDWSDLANQYARVMEQLVRRKSSSRPALIENIIDVAPISISQALLTRAALNLDLLPSYGDSSSNDKLVSDLPVYRDMLGRWIKRVESMFSSGSDFRKEPDIYAVLYRLGQLGGDFAMARAIGKKLVEGGDLSRFMHCTLLERRGNLAYSNLDIVWDCENLVEIIERDTEKRERYKNAIELLQSEEVRDYFKRRSTKPTTKWPPE